MAADLDKPTLDSEYVNVIQDIRDNDKANALMFTGISVQNIPVGAVQFAGGMFGIWNGSSFPVQSIAIGGGGTGATSAAGARSNLDVYSKSEGDSQYLNTSSNGSDIGDDSIFRDNLDVPSKSEAALNADNLGNLGNAATSFDNIKQLASESSPGVVEKASLTEMRDGDLNKFPDAATIEFARQPIEIWAGSSTTVLNSEILSQTGFVVREGRYFVEAAFVDYSVNVRANGESAIGTTRVGSPASNLEIKQLVFSGSTWQVTQHAQGVPTAPTTVNITKIWFTPL